MTRAISTPSEQPRLFTRRLRRPHDSPLGERIQEWRDTLVASDPGLNRLFSAFQVVIAMGVAIGIAWWFIRMTHVMWIEAPRGVTLPPAQAATLAAQHHGVTLLAMMMAGIIALMASSAVNDPTPRDQAITMLTMPIPMVAAMAISIKLAPHRTDGLILMALVLGFGTYLRKFVPRFGPRVALYGMLLFTGYLTGFLSASAIPEDQLGWIAVILWLSILLTMVLKFVVYRPFDNRRFARTIGSFQASGRRVVVAAIALVDARDIRETDRSRRRLHRRMTLLNETALVIDASLMNPGVLPHGLSAYEAHHELFEIELIVQNVGRTVDELALADLPTALRTRIRNWLVALQTGQSAFAAEEARALAAETGSGVGLLAGIEAVNAARIRRLATAICDWESAAVAWPHRRHDLALRERVEPFTSTVSLVFGNLPGSAFVSRTAAMPERGFWERVNRTLHLDPPAQTAIRVAIAVGVASWLGSFLSEQRFYWAVIAVFVASLGTNTSSEQITKAVYRVIGTVIGIFVGSLLAHLVGQSVWSIAVILAAVGIGMYFAPVNYAVMVAGVTIGISQLYEQLGEYSFGLLELRLKETAIGAVVATVAALAIFPVDTRRAAQVAARDYIAALSALLGRAAAWVRGERNEQLTGAARALDAASAQLAATLRPLRFNPFRRDRIEYNLGLFSHAAHEARNLTADIERQPVLEPGIAQQVIRALEREQALVDDLPLVLAGEGTPQHAQRLDLGVDLASGRSVSHAPTDAERAAARTLVELQRLDEIVAELRDNLGSRSGSRSGSRTGSRIGSQA